jgi:hypothetical protein
MSGIKRRLKDGVGFLIKSPLLLSKLPLQQESEIIQQESAPDSEALTTYDPIRS